MLLILPLPEVAAFLQSQQSGMHMLALSVSPALWQFKLRCCTVNGAVEAGTCPLLH